MPWGLNKTFLKCTEVCHIMNYKSDSISTKNTKTTIQHNGFKSDNKTKQILCFQINLGSNLSCNTL